MELRSNQCVGVSALTGILEYAVHAEVKGRPKHFYSIYKKMMARGVDFEQIQICSKSTLSNM